MDSVTITAITGLLRCETGHFHTAVGLDLRYPDGRDEDWPPIFDHGPLGTIDDPPPFLGGVVYNRLDEARDALYELGFGMCFPADGPELRWRAEDEASRQLLASLADVGHDAWRNLREWVAPPDIPDIPDPLADETAAIQTRVIDRLEALTRRRGGVRFELRQERWAPRPSAHVLAADGARLALVAWHGSGISLYIDPNLFASVFALDRDTDDVMRELDSLLDALCDTGPEQVAPDRWLLRTATGVKELEPK
jgi:hypothetical protein